MYSMLRTLEKEFQKLCQLYVPPSRYLTPCNEELPLLE